MKKTIWFPFILILVCIVIFAACDGNSQTNADTTGNSAPNNTTQITVPTSTQHIHSFGEWITNSPPTCTEAGEEERACACGEKEFRIIKAVGHTEVIDQAIAATCDKEGMTEGKHCSVCGEITLMQTKTEMIPHDYKDGTCVVCNFTPAVLISRVWMDNPGETLRPGDTVTFYVEAYFKYNPGNFVLWFKSSENESSIKSAVSWPSDTTSDNIYAVTLSIDENMFPGKWTADWYFIGDQYNTFSQSSFTEQQRQALWFIVTEN